MRFALVGTGPWAKRAHGPGLLACPSVELVGVWGRDPDRASEFAAELGVPAHDDLDDLIDRVDAVAFAVPPDVQAPLAIRAAQAGKHLLLDKPVALDPGEADRLEAAVTAAGTASLVFFTDRFVDSSRAWFEQVRSTPGWQGAWFRWFSSLQAPGNPYGGSPWRRELGALWDTAPHALSTLGAALGPIEAVTAVAGEGDLVTLVLRHRSGATSTAVLSQFVPPAAASFECTLFGEAGLLPMPRRPEGPVADVLALAAGELVAAATNGRPTVADVRLGARITRLLADAQRQLDGQRAAR